MKIEVSRPTGDDPLAWEAYLASEGLGKKLSHIYPGKRVPLGDGLGRKTRNEEGKEDAGKGHSRMCPIVLRPLDDQMDKPNDRPVEAALDK